MPWRLIVFLLSLLVLLVFAGFNMNNASDISFGFHELKDVPVFVSLLFSFILGVLCALPFMYIGKRASSKKEKAKRKSGPEVDTPFIKPEEKSPKKSVFSGFGSKSKTPKKNKASNKPEDVTNIQEDPN